MDNATHSSELNPLLECSSTIFSIISAVRGEDRGSRLEMDLRERILAAFDEMERMAFERQIGSDHLRAARYALAAFVDEAVMSSSWSGRMEWMCNPLQLEMFGDHVAGEGFFNHLNTLRQGGEVNLDALELYYVCLQLGFEGIYKIRGLEHLTALQVDLRAQIENYRGVVDTKLSPLGIPNSGVISRVRREIPSWVIGVFTVSVIFFTYIGYSLAVNKIMNASVQSMGANQMAIIHHVNSFSPAVTKGNMQ